jgi:hypothetical protein
LPWQMKSIFTIPLKLLENTDFT